MKTARIALLLAGASFVCAAPAAADPAVGKPAPAFEILDENDVTQRLADHRGKIVVLEWTNPDCPFVARHYKSDTMEKLSAEYGGKQVVWLAVNSTHYNKPEDTRAWRDAQGFSYPTLQDAAGDVGHAYGARTTPHMFVIDPEGKLAYKGAIDDDPRGRNATPANYVSAALHNMANDTEPDPSQTRPYGCSVKYE